MRFRMSCVCVLVVLGQVRSQNDAPDLARGGGSSSGPPAVRRGGPPPRFVNGPTGFSVEGEHHRATGVRDFVNGPTATSVGMQENRPQGTFMSGPTGISVLTEERRAEEEQSLNVPTRTFIDVQEDRAEGATAVADGPTMTFVEEERSGLEGGQEEDGGRSSNRGIINTNPQEGSEVKQELPPGLHIDTADGSRDTDDWMYTGGEWARVNLPDADHPDIRVPLIPGPALVVVTKDYLKKVTVSRKFVRLTNVMLHYRFFLSLGEVGMHGVPELKVYLVVGNTSIPLAAETSRGDWSDSTLKVPVSPDSESFKIVFEARLMKEGNEIALDDITISGISGNQFGGQDNSSANSTLLPDDATVPVLITETQPQDAANNTLLSEDDNLTDNKTSISLDGVKGDDTTQDEESIVSEVVTPPKNIENVEVEVSEKMKITQDNVSIDIPVVVNNASVLDNVVNMETGNTSSVEWEEETVQLKAKGEYLNGKKKIEKLDIQINADNSKGKQEILNTTTEAETLNDESIGNYNDKLDDGENETFAFSFPTDRNTTAEESMTLAETNLTDENNQTQDNLEATSATSNTNDNVTSSHMPSQPPTLDNKTQSVTLTDDTPDSQNSTFIPSQPQQTSEEVSLAQSTTSLRNTTTIDNSGNPESSSVTSTSNHNSLINNSTSPSGVIIPTVITNTTGTDSPVVMPDESATTSWRVFQVFLVLCLLGLLGLGFLYWKKKRKQEDEIPVFTRPTHTDYHNPTFNMDDDASFVSRGGRHNYKSFE